MKRFLKPPKVICMPYFTLPAHPHTPPLLKKAQTTYCGSLLNYAQILVVCIFKRCLDRLWVSCQAHKLLAVALYFTNLSLCNSCMNLTTVLFMALQPSWFTSVFFCPGPWGLLSCKFQMFLCSTTPDSNDQLWQLLGRKPGLDPISRFSLISLTLSSAVVDMSTMQW